MENTVDLLQIKIDKAKAELPPESKSAIDAVDWRTTVLGMRAEKGYSYTQLEDLELETELMLCGLLNPEDYPKELEKRMNIPKAQVDVLVNEMNEKVFKKIREELVKNIERKKIQETEQKPPISPLPEGEKMKTSFDKGRQEIFSKTTETPDLLAEKELPPPPTPPIRNDEGLQKPPVSNGTSPILTQKLSGSFQIPTVETEHTLNNMTKDSGEEKTKLPKADPYRMPID